MQIKIHNKIQHKELHKIFNIKKFKLKRVTTKKYKLRKKNLTHNFNLLIFYAISMQINGVIIS